MKTARVDDNTRFPPRGGFCWTPNADNPERITIATPAGTVRLKVVRGPDPGDVPDGPKWGWDGNVDFPTLVPSINVDGGHGVNDHWHGYMRAGKLVAT